MCYHQSDYAVNRMNKLLFEFHKTFCLVFFSSRLEFLFIYLLIHVTVGNTL